MPLLHAVLLLSLVFATAPALAAEAYPPDGPALPVVKNTEDAGGAFGQGLQTPPTPKPWDQESLWNMKIEGTVDNQGRPIYQPLVVNQDGRHILYNGNLSGDVQNPLTGQVEPNGTSIIDVSDVAHPEFLFHIPGPPGPVAQAGAQMVRVCSGSVLPHGEKGRWYLLRASGNVGTDESQQLWDVTNPAKPSLLTTIVGGLSNTHKNWWECDTGIAYLVAGSASDGWHQSGSKQHLKIYDLSDSQPSSTTSRNAGQALSQVSSTRHWNAVDIGLAIIVPSISWRAVDCTLSLANMLSRVTMSAVTAVLQTDSARGERRVRLGSLTDDAAPIADR